MATCIAVKRSDGRVCGKKCAPNKLHCGTHDPNKAKRGKKSIQKEEKEALFAIIADVLDYKPSEQDAYEKTYGKRNRKLLRQEEPDFVNSIVTKAVREYSRSETDLYPYVSNSNKKGPQPVPFPRKVWMTVSWYLSNDPKSYAAVAMTCKKLYTVFVRDKVFHYFHPLRTCVLNPKIFMYPIFRVIEFPVPPELPLMLREQELPSVDDMLKVYRSEVGIPKSKFEEEQRKGDIITEFCKTLFESVTNSEEYEELVKGGGLFGDVEDEKDVVFEGLPFNHKVYKHRNAVYVVVQPPPKVRLREIEVKLTSCFRNYNNRSVFQLMRVDQIR